MAARTVEQHIKGGEIRPLLLDFANNFDLEATDQGYYTGDIIYDAPAGNIKKSEGPAGPTRLTGTGSDKPLDIAHERGQEQAMNDIHKNPELLKEFYVYLLGEAKVDLKTYPAGPVGDMEEALKQYLAFEAVVNFFKPWLKKRKGYLVPKGKIFYNTDAEKFHGQEFTKSDIVLALGLKTSTIGNINKYFDHDRLLHTPEAKEWFNSGGVKHGSTYNSMKPSLWKKHVDTNQQAANQCKRNSSSSDSDNSSDEGGNSSDGGQSKRRALKKKKAAKKEKQARKKNSKLDYSNMD
ncbi:hypothetical protein B0H17DRAFT_1140431 [Mycena rosella]|uniref:Uncharacterized protein n=1 Tax=Mycena rosella TaxID=1033263 RepID=A0AAD7D3H7_MYCRO|nr:hypothetical protein B0H17DRAFT_1140431 [Mycena rosella]